MIRALPLERLSPLPPLGRGGRPLRIAYGRVFHEACAFSPLVTERDAFSRFHLVDAALGQACSATGSELDGFMPAAELSGFCAAAKLAGGVEAIPLASSLAVPSGPLSLDCFEWLLSTVLERLPAAGPLDGLYLALHGSMQVVGLTEAPEAVILRRVKEALPAGCKVAVSYDLHANLAAGMIDPVEVMTAYRTNPHYDLVTTGFRAGNRLIRTLRGEITPTHSWRKLPMTLGGGTTISFLNPMRKVFRFMKGLEKDNKVLTASLFMVHPYTSAEDHGWAAHISTDGDPALADRLVEELADRAWAERKKPLPPMRSVTEALDEVAEKPRRTPVTLVDVGDIVGAGAPGGNTRIVEALSQKDRGLRAFVPVHDPALVEALWDREVGSRAEVTLAGTPGYEMPPVPLDGHVGAKIHSDFGRVVRLDVGRFHIAVCEGPPLPIHPKFWTELGLNARDADLIVQKNFFHYRIFYALTSFHHIPVVSEGATNLDRVRNREYAVPTYPRVDVPDWREHDPHLRGLVNVVADAPRPSA